MIQRCSILIFVWFALTQTALAQPGSFGVLEATYSKPMSLIGDHNFEVADTSGLFAKDGGGFQLSYERVYYLIGWKVSYDYHRFGIKDAAFRDAYGAIDIDRRGAINNHNFSVGPVLSLPIAEEQFYWHVSLLGGFRFVNVASRIDLTYDPTFNRFTTVTLRNANHISSFYTFNTGFKYFFTDGFGVSAEAGYLGGTINTIKYKYEGTGSKEVNGTDELRQRMDYISFRVGIVFGRMD